MSGVVVAVTGAAGFVAGELIYQLLEKGYAVRGTADLLKEGSFDECFRGVKYVFHTASPFLRTWTDPQKDMVDPALLGTKNVLASVEKNLDTIKKVVITSSAAAVVHQHPPEDKDKVWTEEDWNTTSSLTAGPYRLSKYLAETAAWDWAKGKEDKVKLLTVNPCFVLGVPRHKRTDGVSITTLVRMLDGTTKESGCSNGCFGIADNRNVAQAHIACVENEEASGRYLVTSTTAVSELEYAAVLKKHFPDYPVPDKMNGEITYIPKYSQEKTTRELGIKFYPYEESIAWMAQGLIDLGYIEKI